MSSTANNVDADIQAAFGNAPPSAAAPKSKIDDDVAAAFAPKVDPPKVKSSGDRLIDQMNRGPDNPMADVVHQAVSGAGHSAYGGIKGLVTLLNGDGVDAAAKAVTDEQAKTFTPSGESQRVIDRAKAAATALMPGAQLSGQVQPAADALADKSADLGAPPSVSTVIKAAPAAAGAAMGVKGIIEGGMPATAADTAQTAQDIINKSTAGQSMGAASATHDIQAISPELQQAVIEAARRTGGAVNPEVLRNHIEAEEHGVQLMKGQATRDFQQFQEEADSDHPDIKARIGAQNGQLTDALDTIRRNASPTTVGNDYVENGRQAVDALKAYDEPIQADIKAKYKALADANGGSMPVDGRSFVDQADADLKAQMKARYLPAEIRGTLDDLREGGDFSFSNFENLRTDLAAASRKAEASGDGNAKGAINITRNALEQLPLTGKFTPVGMRGIGVSGVVDPQAMANIKNLADQARSAARARFDALEADPAYEAAVNDVSAGNKKGSPTPLADTFLDKYAMSKSAPKSQVDLMMQKIKATDPDAAGAVASHALNAVRKAAINPNGNVLPNGYNGALQKLGPKLDSLIEPETKDSLESLGRVITNAKVPPPGAKINYSRSGVIMRDALQSAAEGLANAKTLGLYGKAKQALNLSENAFARDALKPGAGLEQLATKP